MVFAQLYRRDLITGEPDHKEGFVVISSRGIPEMHEEATIAARRYGADAYKLFHGTSFRLAKPLSLKHLI